MLTYFLKILLLLLTNIGGLGQLSLCSISHVVDIVRPQIVVEKSLIVITVRF